ncbi:1-phosphofructokinase family hexose kinase, partial [Histophilus somni]|uniref:1-phosphofructokinase family hexose kinase n=1 Tax=Histophilus somni TaxID=731 RepID=UPI00201F2A98
HIVRVDNLELSETNRMVQESIVAGGKGINVSKILSNLGKESTALGYLAGFSGKEIDRLLKEKGIKTDFIFLDRGFTRINVKIKAETETEINGPGLDIKKKDKENLLEQLINLKDRDVLFLSGSVPSSLGVNFYQEIMEELSDKDLTIVVDTIGDSLINTLDLKPFLIKPN